MLAKCANPACGTPFHHLNDGKLFQVEGESLPEVGRFSLRKRRHYIERYWLCDACAAHLTLTFEKGRGVVPVPLAARRPPVPVPTNRPAVGYSLAARIA
jgi:hypothetical protein